MAVKNVIEGVPSSLEVTKRKEIALSDSVLERQITFSISSCIVEKCDIEIPPKELTFIDCNRKIDLNHVNKLAESIKEDGFHDWEPVICNEDGVVIEGQHRLLAALKVGVKPHVIIKSKLSPKDIIKCNTQSKNWKLADFVHYHSKYGRNTETFKRFYNFYEESGLSVASCFAIIKQRDYTGWDLKDLREGSLSCTEQNIKEGRIILNKVLTILDLLPTRNVERAVRALISMIKYVALPNTDDLNKYFGFYDILAERLRADRSSIYPCSSTGAYLEMFARFYNKRMPERQKIKIFRQVV